MQYAFRIDRQHDKVFLSQEINDTKDREVKRNFLKLNAEKDYKLKELKSELECKIEQIRYMEIQAQKEKEEKKENATKNSKGSSSN